MLHVVNINSRHEVKKREKRAEQKNKKSIWLIMKTKHSLFSFKKQHQAQSIFICSHSRFLAELTFQVLLPNFRTHKKLLAVRLKNTLFKFQKLRSIHSD
jgi:hypothetical protein